MAAVDPFLLAESHAVYRTWRQGLDPQRVLEGFDFLCGMAPRLAESWTGAGEVLLALDDPRGALTRHAEALRLAPGEPAVRLGRGAALVAAGRPRAAIIELRLAVALDPIRPRGWSLLAEALEAAGRGPEADRAAAEALLARRAIARARSGIWPTELRGRWRWIVASGPASLAARRDDPRAWWRVASVLRLTGRLEEEAEIARAARRLSNDPESLLERARLLASLPALPDRRSSSDFRVGMPRGL